MAHIHTQPGQYDLTVSAYIIKLPTADDATDAPRVLLHRHKTLGVLMQPGGHVELDETPWQSVAHEVREETGYDLDQLYLLQPEGGLTDLTGDVVHPQPVVLRSFPFGDLPHFHTDLAFAFTTAESPRQEVGEGESHEFVWLTRDELRELPEDQTYPDVKQVIDHIFSHVLTTWERVPTISFSLGNQ